jgi:hypothetical protein
MSTPQLSVDEFSFSTHVEQVCDNWKGLIEETDGPKEYGHATWGEGVAITLTVPDRDRPHRPNVSTELDREVTEMASKNHPQVPTDELSFEKRLALVLDKAEAWYNLLDVGVRLVPE